MNPPDNTVKPASPAEQCAEIVRKLSATSQTRHRVWNGLLSLGLTLYFGWSAWNDCVRLENGGARVMSIGSAMSLAVALAMTVSTIQQLWPPPKDRLLLLLAEDYLARSKEGVVPPAPTP